MQRRTVLRRTAAAAVGAALAGCLGSATGDETTDPPSATGSTDPPSSDSTATTGASRDEATVRLVVENRDDVQRAGTVELTRIATPACRYETPQCQRPSEQTVVSDGAFDLGPGERRAFPPATMQIGADDVVDSYEVVARTGDGPVADLLGLESGAATVVGRAEANAYPWRVGPRAYLIRTAVLPDGEVRVSVGDPAGTADSTESN